MTGAEHIVAWIESSGPEYQRLLRLSHRDQTPETWRANEAASLALSAYHQMIRGGDAYAAEHDASTILEAALMLAKWERPE